MSNKKLTSSKQVFNNEFFKGITCKPNYQFKTTEVYFNKTLTKTEQAFIDGLARSGVAKLYSEGRFEEKPFYAIKYWLFNQYCKEFIGETDATIKSKKAAINWSPEPRKKTAKKSKEPALDSMNKDEAIKTLIKLLSE